MLRRLPGTKNFEDKDFDLSRYKNKIGFTYSIVNDLQRIFACLLVQSATLSAADKKYLASVASSEHAQRLCVSMSAQGEWRQGLGHATSPSVVLPSFQISILSSVVVVAVVVAMISVVIYSLIVFAMFLFSS